MISLLATLLLLMMRLPHKRHNMLPLTLCQKCVFNPPRWISTQDLSSGYNDFERQSKQENKISQLWCSFSWWPCPSLWPSKDTFPPSVLQFGTILWGLFRPFHSDPTDDASPPQKKTQYASSQVFHLGLYGPKMVKEKIMRKFSYESQLLLFPNDLQMIQR